MNTNETKTNAARLLESAGVGCELFSYPVADGRIDARSVAEKLGVPPEQVFKTLVTEGADGEHYVFVIPGTAELNLKRAAKAAGLKSVAMLASAKLLGLTGYVHGGCSPVGMKRALPTFLDESAILYDRIWVSAGRVGVNMAVAPEALAGAVEGVFAPLT